MWHPRRGLQCTAKMMPSVVCQEIEATSSSIKFRVYAKGDQENRVKETRRKKQHPPISHVQAHLYLVCRCREEEIYANVGKNIPVETLHEVRLTLWFMLSLDRAP